MEMLEEDRAGTRFKTPYLRRDNPIEDDLKLSARPVDPSTWIRSSGRGKVRQSWSYLKSTVLGKKGVEPNGKRPRVSLFECAIRISQTGGWSLRCFRRPLSLCP